MTVYYQESDYGTFVYDDKAPLESAFSIKHSTIGRLLLSTMIKTGKFMGNDKKHYTIREEPLKFFIEFIPRVFGFSAKIEKVKSLDDVP